MISRKYGLTIVMLIYSSALGAQLFDNGIPSIWSCEGNCDASGADGVVTLAAGGGNQYGWVSTNSGVQDVELKGVGGEGMPTTGSRLRSSVIPAAAGSDLNFRFNYVTSDGAEFTDYAWARLLDQSLQEVALLFTARTTPDGNSVPGFAMPPIEAAITPATVEIIPGGPEWSPLGLWSGFCFEEGCGYSDWAMSSFTIPADGGYILEFGVVNWNDKLYDSGLAFDRIQLDDQPIFLIFKDRFEE